jgi:hypothetical protein
MASKEAHVEPIGAVHTSHELEDCLRSLVPNDVHDTHAVEFWFDI